MATNRKSLLVLVLTVILFFTVLIAMDIWIGDNDSFVKVIKSYKENGKQSQLKWDEVRKGFK